MDYGEFVAISLHLKRMANDEHLHRAFSYFDKDGDGYIEQHELRDALTVDGDEDCTIVANDIFQEVDTDKVKNISFLFYLLQDKKTREMECTIRNQDTEKRQKVSRGGVKKS